MHRRPLAVDCVFAVAGAEDEPVELVELLPLILLPGGQRTPEHLEAAGGLLVRLLPELPVRTFLGVHLLEREIAPIDLEVVRTELLSHVADPLGRAECPRAEEIKIEVNRYRLPICRHELNPPKHSKQLCLRCIQYYQFGSCFTTCIDAATCRSSAGRSPLLSITMS